MAAKVFARSSFVAAASLTLAAAASGARGWLPTSVPTTTPSSPTTSFVAISVSPSLHLRRVFLAASAAGASLARVACAGRRAPRTHAWILRGLRLELALPRCARVPGKKLHGLHLLFALLEALVPACTWIRRSAFWRSVPRTLPFAPLRKLRRPAALLFQRKAMLEWQRRWILTFEPRVVSHLLGRLG